MNVNGMLHWSLNLEAAIWSPLPTLRTFKLSENPKFQRINFTRVTTNLSKHHSIPTSSQALISIFFSHLSPQSAKKLPENNGLQDSHYLLAPSLLPPPGEVQPLPQDRRHSARASHSFPQAGRGSSPSPAGGCRGSERPSGMDESLQLKPRLVSVRGKKIEKKKPKTSKGEWQHVSLGLHSKHQGGCHPSPENAEMRWSYIKDLDNIFLHHT